MPNSLADLYAGSASLVDLVTIYHKDETGSTHTYRFSTESIKTANTYLGGTVLGGLLDINSTRPNVDRQGGWQTATLTCTFADNEYMFRRWMDSAVQSKIRGAYIAYASASRSEILASTTPTSLWVGKVDTIRLMGDWQFQIVAKDILSFDLDQLYPQTFINTTNFSGCLTRVVGLAEPIIFGTIGSNDPTWGGECPTIYTGVPKTISGDPTWRQVLICRHRLTTIDKIWYDGVDVTATVDASGIGIITPQHPVAGWALAEAADYKTINGRDYSICYVHGTEATALDAGTSTLTLGVTSPFTGNAVTQLAYFLDNWYFKQYESGSYYTYTDATYPDGTTKRDNSTFSTYGALCSTNTAFVLNDGNRKALRDILAGFALCGDLNLALNASGQIEARWDESGSLPSSVSNPIDDTLETCKGSFSVEHRPVENYIEYGYGPTYVGGEPLAAGLTTSDSTSITAHGTLKAQPLDFWMLRDSTSASNVVARRLIRSKQPKLDGAIATLGLSDASGGAYGRSVGRPFLVSSREAPGGGKTWFKTAVADGATHIWRLGEQHEQTPTTAKDAVGTADGTYVGSPQFNIGKPDPDHSTAMQADNSNDKITLASAITLTTTVSFEFLIAPDSSQTATYGCIFSLDTAATGIYYKKGSGVGNISVFWGATDHLNSTSITDGALAHVIISISAGSGTFYLNGVADGTFSSYTGWNLDEFCHQKISAGNYLKAFLIGDLAIYPTALTAQQAATHYARTRSIDPSSLGWSSKVVRCEGMEYDGRSKVMTYRFSEWAVQ